jgi:hypothetical protein
MFRPPPALSEPSPLLLPLESLLPGALRLRLVEGWRRVFILRVRWDHRSCQEKNDKRASSTHALHNASSPEQRMWTAKP